MEFYSPKDLEGPGRDDGHLLRRVDVRGVLRVPQQRPGRLAALGPGVAYFFLSCFSFFRASLLSFEKDSNDLEAFETCCMFKMSIHLFYYSNSKSWLRYSRERALQRVIVTAVTPPR